MRRANAEAIRLQIPMPQSPEPNPDPLFGQPEAKEALKAGFLLGHPVLLEAPESFLLGVRLEAFFSPLLKALPDDPPLVLEPDSGLWRVVERPRDKAARVLRPGGRPGFLYDPYPTPNRLFGDFAYREGPHGPCAGPADFRPGSLFRVGSGVVVLEARPIAQNATLREALVEAIRLRAFQPRAPNPCPGPLPPEFPLRARVVLVGDGEALEAIATSLQRFEWARLRVDLPLSQRTLAWLWGEFSRLFGSVTRDDIQALAPHLARKAGHAERLSAEIGEAVRLLEIAGKTRQPLARIIAGERRRQAQSKKRYLKEVVEGQWRLELKGHRIGEVLGALVIEEGDAPYGQPVRITATVAPGRDGVISIERESQLAGPLFSKAVLTLSGYLRGHYADVGALSATISLVFEQLGEEIDGDSAGLAELLAVLSAASGLALRQDVVITGAIDQKGNVLPVGGIIEKVEGVFATASALGRNGAGIVIPLANRKHLVASPALVRAVERARFHIYLAQSVDEVIAFMTGKPAGLVHQRVRETFRNYLKLESGGA